MQKLRIRIRVWFLIALAVLLLLTTIAGNIYLNTSVKDFIESRDDLFTHKVTARYFVYLFPSLVIIKDLTLVPPTTFSQDKALTLSTVVTKFSILRYFQTRKVSLKEIRIADSKINFNDFQEFLSINAQKLIWIVKQIPKDDVKIVLKKNLWDIGQIRNQPQHVNTNFHLVFKGDKIKGGGFWEPIKFVFNGTFTRSGFSIDQLVLGNNVLYSNLWGSVNGGVLKLQGYTFAKTKAKKVEEQKSFKDRLGVCVQQVKEFFGFQRIKRLSNPNIFLLDIDTLMHLDFPEILVKRFGFTLNNDPIRLNGKVNLKDTVAVDLVGSYQPVRKSGKFELLDLVTVDLSGQFKKSGFVSQGRVDAQFKVKDESSSAIKKGEFGFKGLLVGLDPGARLRVTLDEGNLAFWTKEDVHQLRFDRFNTFFNYAADTVKYIDVQSRFYDGGLHGRVWVDSKELPLKMTSVVFFDRVNANNLGGMIPQFTQVFGTLSSRMTIRNDPEFEIKGNIHVKDGELVDYEFFKWLAESFDMPSLRDVNFSTVSTNFSMGFGGMNLDNILLDAKDVKVKGYFRKDSKDLVSSKLSLVFSSEILYQSRKFRPIVKMFERGTESLNFEFQLSGHSDAMNFQWLDSEVKRQIQSRIPDFIERKIERGIDEMIEAPQSQEDSDAIQGMED